MDPIWNRATVMPIDRFVWGIEATGEARLLWDYNFLYALFDIFDADLDASNPQEWYQSSVDVYVSEHRTTDFGYFEGDRQYRVNFENVISGSASQDMRDALVTAVSITDTGYRVEMRIPFHYVEPSEGHQMGFDVQINEVRFGMRTGVIKWNDYTGNAWQDMSIIGGVTLRYGPRMETAVFTPTAPEINGVLDGTWANANVFDITRGILGAEDAPRATARTMWNNDYLFLFMEIVDDFLDDSHAQEWYHDSIEIYFGEFNARGFTYSPNDRQYRVNFNNHRSGAATYDRFYSATTITATGWNLEARFPFRALEPTNGHILGFDLQINGVDEGGVNRTVHMMHDPSGDSWQNATQWGELMLIGG
jgi:endo-1,4-beta-xylanase